MKKKAKSKKESKQCTLKKAELSIDKFSKEIAKRRQAEEALERNQRMLRSILEVEPLGVYIVNRKGNVDYVNSVMIVISGDTYEQFKSLNVFQVPTYKVLGLDKKIKSVFEGHSFKLSSVKYTSYYSKKATIRNFIGIPYEEERERKALIFVQDITELKRAEERMREAMELKSKFTSMVSHELRTPLTAIREGIRVVLDGSVGELQPRQKEFLEIAQRNVDRLSRLINDVLDYQKLEAGKMVFSMQQDDINEVVREVEKTMSQIAKEKGLKLELDLDRALPKINFSRDRITQVLANLVNNAIKYTEKGRVAISTKRVKNTVCVSVGDTGAGIREEDIPKLFQPFEQLERGKDKGAGGTGLGLAISKEIIMRHKGKIWAESELSKGATFHFALPITERRA